MIPKFSFIILCLLLKDVDCVEVLAEVGSEAILPCKTSPQTVSPAVTWSNSKGSVWKMLRSGLRFWSLNTGSRVICPHKQFHRGDYNLHIRNVTEEDAGLYSCILELNNIRTPMTTQVTLRVIKVTISPATPLIGQSVSIRCSVSRGKEPRVSWMLNGSPYEEKKTYSSRTVREDGNTALRIKASESLRGNWTCVVSSQGNEGRATALLDVKGIIQPPSDDARIYAAVGSAVTLPCVFSKGLTPPSALWERLQDKARSKSSLGNLPASFSQPSSLGSTEDRTASLNEVSFENAGRYRCSATVQGQRIERIMQLVTAKVEVEVVSKADVKLTCRLSDSSAITGYEWIYTTFDLNGTEFTASVEKDQTVTLSQTSRGLWTCRFYGQQRLLGNVTYLFQYTERQTEDTLDSASHGAALILVGLILLILILLLVLNQMYKNYQRRKRLLQFPALETILHSKSVEQEMNERCQTQK